MASAMPSDGLDRTLRPFESTRSPSNVLSTSDMTRALTRRMFTASRTSRRRSCVRGRSEAILCGATGLSGSLWQPLRPGKSVGEGLAEADLDQLPDQGGGQGFGDVEVERPCCHCVAAELVLELGKDGAAVRQVAQVGLERGEAGDRLAANLEGRSAVGNALLGV